MGQRQEIGQILEVAIESVDTFKAKNTYKYNATNSKEKKVRFRINDLTNT